MNRARKAIALPALTADFLTSNGILLDNLFASLWRELGMKTLLSRAGFKKRSGTSMDVVLYHLVLWVWLKQKSIGMFARERLHGAMGKDTLHDLINWEDLNRRVRREVARFIVTRPQRGDVTRRTLGANTKQHIRKLHRTRSFVF